MNARTPKSRNGCLTCRRRRIKCDEAKPICLRCQTNNVGCDGYANKEYKWRIVKDVIRDKRLSQPREKPLCARSLSSPPSSTSLSFWDLDSAFHDASIAFSSDRGPLAHKDQSQEGVTESETVDLYTAPTQPVEILPKRQTGPPASFVEATAIGASLQDHSQDRKSSTVDMLPPQRTEDRDLMLDFDETFSTEAAVDLLGDNPFDGFDNHILLDFLDTTLYPPDSTGPEITNHTARSINQDEQTNALLQLSADSSHQFDLWPSHQEKQNLPSLTQPDFDVTSLEMLMLRYDKETCGILSVKDGPTENPWRTLIWPLAKVSSALYYAIASMTAFHGAYDIPSLATRGMELGRQSRELLEAQLHDMDSNTAVATLLVLSFAESWKSPERTTTQHLHKARKLVTKALMKDQGAMRLFGSISEDAQRLKYLCNAYVYMDAISRLTNPDEEEDFIAEILSAVNHPTKGVEEVDPLLGSAVTLFPLVGKTANLVNRISRLERTSLSLVSQAFNLQLELQQWKAPSPLMLEHLSKEGEVISTIQTAEALRYSMLLLLYQAVPELPSFSAEELARKVLTKLAVTSTTSHATNLQIFPLFAASCEVTGEDDRNWVRNRWKALISRLRVKNVVRSWELVQEVWARRDEHEAHKTRTSISDGDLHAAQCAIDYTSLLSSESRDHLNDADTHRISRDVQASIEGLEEEYTIRGELHWLQVMKGRQWQIFFG